MGIIDKNPSDVPGAVQPDLQELVLRAHRGEVVAFDALVRSHQSFVFALSLRLLCNEDEARDVVQDVFVKVWRNLGRYDPRRKFTTWLYAITTNLCLDRLRSAKRKAQTISSNAALHNDLAIPGERDLESEISNGELAGIIRKLTERLPERQRIVFTLRDLQDLSVEEVVEITGLSRESVKSNLYCARERIRTLLAKHYKIERT
jgi:RNA polymerase sigma-70 factor (ECF subfamily)